MERRSLKKKSGLIFFRLLLSNCLSWKNYCDDHSSLSFPFISIHSDASNVACAGHIAGKDVHAHRMFKEAERQESSTYRELLAVQFVLTLFSLFLPNSRVKWFTDSQRQAGRIMQVGSMNFNLHKLAADIFFLLLHIRN